ncbi:hypothetical protein CF142_02065 [Aeromonas caviae]|nr:hypothetical protein CF142_02065 [Aeromonas caviae]
MNINANKFILMMLFFVLLSLLLFPLLSYVLSSIMLILIVNNREERSKIMFSLFFVILVLSHIVNEVSVQKFLIREDDFTTYYSNYLDLLHGNYEALFVFGGGIEIGLPVVNYVLSIVVDQPMPYLIQAIYIAIFMALLIYLISISPLYDLYSKLALLLWILLFIKFTAMLTIERQAIASFFVIFAIFEPRKKFFWLIIGCIFHLTSPIVYFVTKFVLKVRTYKKALIACSVLFIFTFFSYNVLSAINALINTDKIGYVLYFLNENDLIKNELVKSVKQIIYILPLCVLDPILRCRGIRWEYGPSVFLFCMSMLILSALPGVPSRVLMPIVFILYGYYYYSFFNLFSKKIQVTGFTIIAILFALYKLMLPGYYYRFPILNVYPGYYMVELLEEVGYIDRFSLPSAEDVEIYNGNKL